MRGPLFFGKSPMGGHLFLAKIFYKKPAKPIFLRVSGKNKTKKIFRKKFSRGGATFFDGLENKNLPLPLSINNEPSLKGDIIDVMYYHGLHDITDVILYPHVISNYIIYICDNIDIILT